MSTINPYLNFRDKTEAAFNFYKSIFGGEIITMMRYKDSPEGGKVQAADADKIMHATIKLDNGLTLMATDVLDYMGHQFIDGNNFSLSVDADTQPEADKIFNGLATNGKITMGLQKTFWGAYFGMLVDPFGVQWMVNYDFNKG